MLVGLFVLSFIFKDNFKNNELVILSASQLLWINLLTHGFPAIALGMTPSDVNVMQRKPLVKMKVFLLMEWEWNYWFKVVF
ncbi:cation transporting ATPase C-terminal domain-containing protein [Mycoplasmopsis cynos]|nr:cation transporting ATPase C-terminal domain-containing protein [Mycoplasmopsis cynos]UWV82996.1 cation transporting ATPase C-terminal domain-containing protein [Mycoplasmopsis cynos]